MINKVQGFIYELNLTTWKTYLFKGKIAKY